MEDFDEDCPVEEESVLVDNSSPHNIYSINNTWNPLELKTYDLLS